MAEDTRRRKTRISGKLDALPPEVKQQIDGMVSDPAYTYTDIAAWLKEQGFEISRSAVGRYAIRVNEAARRVNENLQKTKAILETLERNPELDAGKASTALMMDGLMQRMSTAEEDYLEMPLDKAGRLLAQLRRIELQDKRLKLDERRKIELAFAGLEEKMLETVKGSPELARRMRDLLIDARQMILAEE